MADRQTFAVQRRYPRNKVILAIKVFTSMSRCPLTLQATELGQKGAFVTSRFLPEVGEPITCQFIDESCAMILQKEARVAYTCRLRWEGKIGFGIEFDTPLTSEMEKKIGVMSVDLGHGNHRCYGAPYHLF